MKVVWDLFGVEPPRSSNILALLFGLGTLGLVWLFMLRMNLPRKLEGARTPLLALVLLGTVTNRTFLTWLSSGLETALFNFLLIWWVYEGLTDPLKRTSGWVFRFTLAASLAALARPDGYLAWLATFVILVKLYLSAEKRVHIHLAIPVLAAVPLHMVWRQFTYGTWLPNTYYAKSDSFWPESGVRYLGSFLLENGFWFLVILLCLVLALSLHRIKKEVRSGRKVTLSLHLLLDEKGLVLGTLLAHFSYYTFAIGGDHFEYRVYSHLIPLGFILAAWTVARLSHRATLVLALLSLIVILSYPIPWTHWRETKDLTTRKDTQMMVIPIAHKFPYPIRPAVRAWDSWQEWLIRHYVCMRHQEHKVFFLWMESQFPTRAEGKKASWEDRNVLATMAIGTVGWTFPEVAIIDKLGLTDGVVARSPLDLVNGEKMMAHARKPPPGYLECFRPNFFLGVSKPEGDWELRSRYTPRSNLLTDAEIIACEARAWW
ncbi:MAG: hypothetical protein P1S46_02660 [bacterium]|nr:hypothetical protein [bacterium]